MAATIMAQIPSRNHPYTKIISPPPSPSARSFIFFSDDKGRVLHGEEKAAENIHIQKMEREKLEKAKQKAEKEREEKELDTKRFMERDECSSLPFHSDFNSKTFSGSHNDITHIDLSSISSFYLKHQKSPFTHQTWENSNIRFKYMVVSTLSSPMGGLPGPKENPVCHWPLPLPCHFKSRSRQRLQELRLCSRQDIIKTFIILALFFLFITVVGERNRC